MLISYVALMDRLDSRSEKAYNFPHGQFNNVMSFIRDYFFNFALWGLLFYFHFCSLSFYFPYFNLCWKIGLYCSFPWPIRVLPNYYYSYYCNCCICFYITVFNMNKILHQIYSTFFYPSRTLKIKFQVSSY